ncbi:hypothetical protein ACJ72_08766 [Emergomyces africanus]|uniref:Uncharacterized protein n=1 Tax=Emergomyces africanus TaxID=1955775 RepID=A0A1B7NJB3_9EURO|nr:hypothetical protein ACJ72_08766 [Emergomyces africanus]
MTEEIPELYNSLNPKNIIKENMYELKQEKRTDEHMNTIDSEMLVYEEYVKKLKEVRVNALTDSEIFTEYISDHIVQRLPGIKRVIDSKQIKLSNKQYLISFARLLNIEYDVILDLD